MKSFTIYATVLGFGVMIAINGAASAATVSGSADVNPTKAANSIQVAQGVGPQGFGEKEPPRYKKASARDTTMERCISVAQKEYQNADTQSSERTARYKACMTSAGQRP